MPTHTPIFLLLGEEYTAGPPRERTGHKEPAHGFFLNLSLVVQLCILPTLGHRLRSEHCFILSPEVPAKTRTWGGLGIPHSHTHSGGSGGSAGRILTSQIWLQNCLGERARDEGDETLVPGGHEVTHGRVCQLSCCLS